MSFLRGIEEELVRGDLEVFHEFDASHFISNAKSAITGKVEAVNLSFKLNHYGDMVEKAINNFVNVKMDKNALRTFTELVPKVVDDGNFYIDGIDDVNDIIIRPQYLDQYYKIISDTIDKVIKGELTSESEVVQMIMGTMPMKIEKQVVRTSMPYGMTTKDLLKANSEKLVKVDGKYVSTVVLPFVSKYDSIKDEVNTEASNTLSAIRTTSDKAMAIIKVINNIKTSQTDLPIERIRLLDQVYYNATRGMIEVISYVSFMCIRKLNIMSSNIVACNKLYTDIMNHYSSQGRVSTEAVTDDRFVTNLDYASMSDELIKGRVDAFQALANNIYELHMGIPKVDVGNTPDNVDDYEEPGQTTIDVLMDEQEFDDEIYQTIAKTYIEISNGIDRLARRSDDYLMVFDDIINYAGFTLRLEDRFRNELSKIEDLSLYRGALNTTVAGSRNGEVYKRMLAEVKAFPENMQKIADTALETITKINALNERYVNNINGEFKDLETVNELKIFMKDLIVQYRAYTEMVVSKMMKRLKEIGDIITSMESIINGEKEVEPMTYPEPTDIINYTESVFDSIIEEIDSKNNLTFESLQLEYFSQKEKVNKGINVVYEDENTSGTQPVNNTKVTVQDNNTEQKQTTTQLNISKIGEWFRKIIEQFMNMFNKESKKNAEWLANNKEGLLNRSYNNVTINILPYKNVSPETITGDINKLTSNVNGLSPAVIAGIKTKEDMYKKLFPFVQGGINTANPLKDQFVKYYKVGSAELAVAPIANGELKTEITSVIIPYCESYYNGYINEVNQALEGLTSAVDGLCDKFTSATPQTESVSIFEAGENQPQDTNKEASMSEKASWIKEGIKYFEGSVLNAVRDRKNDYFKVLSSLAPKAPVKPQTPVDVKPDQPTNNNQATEA